MPLLNHPGATSASILDPTFKVEKEDVVPSDNRDNCANVLDGTELSGDDSLSSSPIGNKIGRNTNEDMEFKVLLLQRNEEIRQGGEYAKFEAGRERDCFSKQKSWEL